MTSIPEPTSPKNFAPKHSVDLDPPKDDPISVEELSKCDGSSDDKPAYVAIKGVVYDVSKNAAYREKGQYHVFAGKDSSRALATSSLKEEDCVPKWDDLGDKEKTVLDEWVMFFSKRYSVVGKVVS